MPGAAPRRGIVPEISRWPQQEHLHGGPRPVADGLPLGLAMRRLGWLFPLLQTIHILATGMLLSSAIMISLRLWGVSHAQTIDGGGERYLPWMWGALVVLTLTGTALIVGNPEKPARSRAAGEAVDDGSRDRGDDSSWPRRWAAGRIAAKSARERTMMRRSRRRCSCCGSG